MTFRSHTQPLCRCCGKPIPKATEWHQVRDPRGGNIKEAITGPLYAKADCQRHTNHTVVSVRYHEDHSSLYGPDDSYGERPRRKPDQPRLISQFTTWDGESYVDEFFCGGTCRSKFAYVMALAGGCTKAYSAAMERRKTK